MLAGWTRFAATASVLVGMLALLWLSLLWVLMRARGRQLQLVESLRSTAQQLTETRRIASIGHWRWDLETGLVIWSAEIYRIYGLPPQSEPFEARDIPGRLHPDDRARVKDYLARLRAGGEPSEIEYRILRADDAVRTVYSRGEWTERTPGQRVLQGIQQDITELASVRERLSLAQDIARIGDWEWDIASGEILWSATTYDIYGLDPGTFKPHADNVFQSIHDEDRDGLRAFAAALIDTGTPCEAEFRVIRPDGDVRVISCRGMREIGPDGRIILRSVQQDITELARARDQLRDAEEQYRFLFEHNPLPMWVFERESLAFVAVNDAMVENYRYTREELLAGSMLDIRPPEDAAAVESAARLTTLERPQGRVWTHLRKDGSRLRAAIHTRDILFDGRAARLVLALDVTEQERNEQRFQLVARATSDAVYDLDLGTAHLWWSDSFYSVFGFDRETMPARIQAWEGLVHPDDLGRVNASLTAAIEDPAVSEWEEEYRFQRKDGSYAEVVDRGFLLRANGRAIRMVGGMLDVTQKRRYESDLRLLLRAVEATESGILIADARQPDFPAVYVNRGFEAISGYSAAELIGKDSRVLGFDERDVHTVKAIRRGLHEHTEMRVLLRNRRKDGTLFWNEFYMAPVRDEQGVVTHMVSVSTDVSARQQSEERLHLVVRATSDAIWDSNLGTGVTWRSENVNSLFGYSPGEIGDSLDDWLRLLHPDDRERVAASIQAAHDTAAADWEAEYRFRRKDGTYADVFDRGFLQRDDRGRAIRAVGGMLDITQKRRDETDLRLLRRAVESTEDGVSIADARLPDMPLVYVNSAFERITGYSADEVLGRNCRFLQGDEQDQMGRHEIRRGVEQGREARALLRNYRKDGSLFWNDLHVNPVRDDAGVITHYVGVQYDVTERQRYQEQIAHLATHDELTGLPNRNLLLDRLQQAIASAARFKRGVGVLFVDLDNFKMINDSLGHGAGDQTLRAVAKRFSACVREADTVGRIGGDEFVLLISEQADGSGIDRVIERIEAAFAEPLDVGGHQHYVTCSMGYCCYPRDGDDAEALLMHADIAMYEAKQAGRNRVVEYRPEFDAVASERLHLITRLRQALVREEFVLHFQPLFLADGSATGMEALVRWQHPEQGLLPPGRFIGACESSGLIVELGRWVLREAARHHLLLATRGLGHLTISINVSALQFQPSLLDDVEDVIALYQLPRGALEIELTESAVMADPESAIAIMNRLNALGVSIAVDDFGTGYSSLAYLKRLPISRLKIDRSFVRDLGHDVDDEAICTSIINLARSLDLSTVAEGVETAEQRSWLLQQGCDELQGFLLARPAAFDTIMQLLVTEPVAT